MAAPSHAPTTSLEFITIENFATKDKRNPDRAPDFRNTNRHGFPRPHNVISVISAEEPVVRDTPFHTSRNKGTQGCSGADRADDARYWFLRQPASHDVRIRSDAGRGAFVGTADPWMRVGIGERARYGHLDEVLLPALASTVALAASATIRRNSTSDRSAAC